MISALDIFPVLLVQAAWFLAPGLALAIWLYRKQYLAAHYIVIVGGILGAVLGYGAFWAYLGDRHGGQLYSFLTIDLAVYSLLWMLLHREVRSVLRRLDVAIPLALLMLVSLLYTSLTLSCTTVRQVTNDDQFCHTSNIAFDNILPQLFADNIYNGHPKALIGDWQGSDRPPLQAGVVLMQAPLTERSGVRVQTYQLISTLLQVLWIPAVWALSRDLKLTGKQLGFVLSVCIMSGFFFFNNVFVWPKLLAGSAVLMAFGLLFYHTATRSRWLLAGLGIACGYLAHSSIIFTVLPMAGLLLLPRYRPGWRPAVAAAVAALVLVAPWMYYQSHYDPPGDRLAKWHLAGDPTINSRPFLTDLRNAYAQTPFPTLLHNKLRNATVLVGIVPAPIPLYMDNHVVATVRGFEFRALFAGLGLLNLGWIGLAVPRFRQRLAQSNLSLPGLKLLFAVGGLAVVVWIFGMFGPASTVIHQGSYATIMLLYIGLGALTGLLSTRLRGILLALQATYFILVWIVSIWLHQRFDSLYIVWMLVAIAGIAWCIRYMRQLPAEGKHGTSY